MTIGHATPRRGNPLQGHRRDGARTILFPTSFPAFKKPSVPGLSWGRELQNLYSFRSSPSVGRFRVTLSSD